MIGCESTRERRTRRLLAPRTDPRSAARAPASEWSWIRPHTPPRLHGGFAKAAQAHPQRKSCHTQGTGISGDQQGGWQATTGSDQRSGGCKSFLKAYTNEARRLSSHAKRAGKGTDRNTLLPQTHAARHLHRGFRLSRRVLGAADDLRAELVDEPRECSCSCPCRTCADALRGTSWA